MDYDEEKVREVVLALLYIWSWQEMGVARSWKGIDWDVLDNLHERDWISDARNRAKSIALTEEGIEQAKAFVAKYLSPD